MTIWYVTANNLANSALGDGTVTAEWELEADNTHTPANDGTTKSVSLLADQSGWAEIIYTFAGPAHTSATWGTITFSDLTMSLDIASFGTTGSLLGSVYRQDSGTISNRSLGSLQSISATTGVVTVNLFTNWNADSGSGNAATDIIAWDLKPTNSNMMTATTLTIYVTDSNTYLDVPLTPPSSTPTIACQTISTSSTIHNPSITGGYPTANLIPTSVFAQSGWVVTGAADAITAVTDGSDSSYCSANETDAARWHFTDFPSDFGEIISLTVTTRCSADNVNDTHDVEVAIITTTESALSDAVIADTGISYSVRNKTTPITGLTSITDKAVWDAALMRIRLIETQSAGDDGTSTRLYETSMRLTYDPSTPTITCPVISASSTINNFTVRPVQKINFDVLTVPSSILNPTVFLTQTVTAQLLSAPSTIPNPSVVQNIELQVINSPSTLFNPTIKQDVILPVVVTASTINNPSVLHRFLISMQVLNASSTIFSPTVNQDIALNVYNSVTTIFSPSLNQDVVLPILNAPENVLMPATDTSVNIEMLFIADDSTIFDPALNQDVSLDVYNAPATVPNPTVTQVGAEQDISLVVIDASSTVLNPSVTTLTTVVAQVLDSPSTVFSPSLKYDVVVPVINTVSTIFSPSLEQIVQMQLVNTAPTVYAPRIGEEVDDGFSGAIIDRPGFPPFPIGIR